MCGITKPMLVLESLVYRRGYDLRCREAAPTDPSQIRSRTQTVSFEYMHKDDQQQVLSRCGGSRPVRGPTSPYVVHTHAEDMSNRRQTFCILRERVRP